MCVQGTKTDVGIGTIFFLLTRSESKKKKRGRTWDSKPTLCQTRPSIDGDCSLVDGIVSVGHRQTDVYVSGNGNERFVSITFESCLDRLLFLLKKVYASKNLSRVPPGLLLLVFGYGMVWEGAGSVPFVP